VTRLTEKAEARQIEGTQKSRASTIALGDFAFYSFPQKQKQDFIFLIFSYIYGTEIKSIPQFTISRGSLGVLEISSNKKILRLG